MKRKEFVKYAHGLLHCIFADLPEKAEEDFYLAKFIEKLDHIKRAKDVRMGKL